MKGERLDWRDEAGISRALEQREWAQVDVQIGKKSFSFYTFDRDPMSGDRKQLNFDLDLNQDAMRLRVWGKNNRQLTLTISPHLVAEIVFAIADQAAKKKASDLPPEPIFKAFQDAAVALGHKQPEA